MKFAIVLFAFSAIAVPALAAGDNSDSLSTSGYVDYTAFISSDLNESSSSNSDPRVSRVSCAHSKDSGAPLPAKKNYQFRERPDTSVRFTWCNPNPVLFLYEDSVGTPRLTTNAESLKKFAEALSKLSVQLPKSTSTSTPTPAPTPAPAPAKGRSKNDKPVVLDKPVVADPCSAPKGEFEIKGTDVSQIIKDLNELGRISTTEIPQQIDLSREENYRNKYASSLQNLKKILQKAGTSLDAIVGLSVPSTASVDVKMCPPGKSRATTQITLTASSFNDIDRAINDNVKNNAFSDEDATWARTILGALRDVRASSAEVRELQSAVSSVLDDLDRVGLHKDFGSAVVVSPNAVIPQTIRLKANEQHKAFFSPGALKAQERAALSERTIDILPDDEFVITPSIGLIYSFVKQRSYSAVTRNGQLVLAETDSDYNAVSGVFAFNVTRHVWARRAFAPSLQFGIVPSSDKFALLLGLGFTSTTNVSFFLGAVFQRVEVLGSGLQVGQSLASADEIQRRNEFRTGLYMSLSYEFKTE